MKLVKQILAAILSAYLILCAVAIVAPISTNRVQDWNVVYILLDSIS